MELIEKIEQEARKEIEQIIAQAKAKVEEMLQEEERRLKEWAESFRKEKRAEAEGERRLILSKARAQAQQEYIKAKEQVVAEIFAGLQEEAARLRANPQEYKRFFALALQEAQREIGHELLLSIDPQDEALVKEFSKHKISNSIKTLGGFIAQSPDGSVVLDNRLETRIENLKNIYRPRLNKLLFDRGQPEL